MQPDPRIYSLNRSDTGESIVFMKEIIQNSAVLGIDAAWTVGKPSGISLLVQTDTGWNSVALAPSYEQFMELADGKAINWDQTPKGGEPDLKMLVQAAQQMVSPTKISTIAVDIPISLQKISGRRAADSAISRSFGAKGCSTHSPNEQRPGPLADKYRVTCDRLGFQLATTSTPVGSYPSLIEVYPHTALLELLGLDFRLPYKVEKSNSYWKAETAQKRKSNLVAALNSILTGLSQKIDSIPLEIPDAGNVPSFKSLKCYEDALDALICAWVAIAYLEEECVSHGDERAAIWVPVSTG